MLLKRKIGSFRYTPYVDGNRSLPDAERMSFLLRPVTRLERLAQIQWSSPDELAAWRSKALATQLKDTDYGALIGHLPVNVQVGLRQFMEHVSEPRNVVIEDEGGRKELTDPVEIYLQLVSENWEEVLARTERIGNATPFEDAEDASACGLVAELQFVLNQTAELRGDELVNFASLCAGSSSASSTATSADPVTATVPSVPVEPIT